MNMKPVSTGWFLLGLLLLGPFPRQAVAASDIADRGPTFSGTIRARFPGDNTAMKGIVVTLGTETNAFICYDTDLMRVSLGWTGDYLKFGNYLKEVVHPQPPEVAGLPVFGTKPGPGWASNGRFEDPRSKHLGPLPATWAKYRGLYLHDREAVFSYTVGEAHILDRPGLEHRSGLSIFTRTIELDRPSRQTLLVCEGVPKDVANQAQSDRAVLLFGNVELPRDPVSLGVALVGAPEATLEAVDGRVLVKLSGQEKPGSAFTVGIWSGPPDDAARFEPAIRAFPKPSRLTALTKGGPGRWKEPVVTQGALATSYDQPICWLPMNMDNSSGGQVWVTSDQWGPFKNHLLFMSYGRGTLFHVLTEEVDGVTQAGLVRFPLKFPTGLMRGRCHPKDGQIYLCGLRGWQTDGTRDGGFYRVRFTGKPVHMPLELHALKDGLKITFTGELDLASATDLSSYAIEQWNYIYTGNYGSPEVSVADPNQKRHDQVEIKSVRLAQDKRTVLLEVPGLQPVHQMKIKMNLKAADGTEISQEIYNTIHKLGSTTVASAK